MDCSDFTMPFTAHLLLESRVSIVLPVKTIEPASGLVCVDTEHAIGLHSRSRLRRDPASNRVRQYLRVSSSSKGTPSNKKAVSR